MPKNCQEQQALFGKDEEMPIAQALVYISDVGLEGLGISDYWDAVRYDNEDLSSPVSYESSAIW